jgi:hypothetical protein
MNADIQKILDENFKGKKFGEVMRWDWGTILIEQPQMFDICKGLGICKLMSGWYFSILLSHHPQLFNKLKEEGLIEVMEEWDIATVLARQPQLASEFNKLINNQGK